MVEKIYKKYNEELRPLISEVEGRLEYFEEPLLENIASKFDSIVLSHFAENSSENAYNLEQANTYLDICISQSYQYIITDLDKKRRGFEKICPLPSCKILNNGQFYNEYLKHKKIAKENVKEGLKKDDFMAMDNYKTAYESYTKLERLIDSEVLYNIIQKSNKKSIFYTVFSIIFPIIISIYIGRIVNEYKELIMEIIKQWINV